MFSIGGFLHFMNIKLGEWDLNALGIVFFLEGFIYIEIYNPKVFLLHNQ